MYNKGLLVIVCEPAMGASSSASSSYLVASAVLSGLLVFLVAITMLMTMSGPVAYGRNPPIISLTP